MEQKVLATVKKLLGVNPDDPSFDLDIILAIESSLEVARELGVPVTTGLLETNQNVTWDEVCSSSEASPLLKTYVVLKSRTIFDPPTGSAVKDSFDRVLAEYEWRLNHVTDVCGLVQNDDSV